MSGASRLRRLRVYASELRSIGMPLLAGAVDEAAAEIERLQAEVERLTLTWSDEPPSEDGLHMIRTSPEARVRIVPVSAGVRNPERGLLVQHATWDQWKSAFPGFQIAGPFPTPKET